MKNTYIVYKYVKIKKTSQYFTSKQAEKKGQIQAGSFQLVLV